MILKSSHHQTPIKRLGLAALITYAALPISAFVHLILGLWAFTTDLPPFGYVNTFVSQSWPGYTFILQTWIEAYAAFVSATAFSFLLSWIGYLFLLPIFLLQRKIGFDGWLPTALIGAALGAFAVMPISLGSPDFARASKHLFDDMQTSNFVAQGVLHALCFWACLSALNSRDQPPQ